MSIDSLTALIRTIPDFPKPGIQFRDVTTLLADGPGFAELVERLTSVARPLDPDLIVGIEARGFILGAALAAMVILVILPWSSARETVEDRHLLDFRPVLRNRPAMSYILAYCGHNWELGRAVFGLCPGAASRQRVRYRCDSHRRPGDVAGSTLQYHRQ